ncbi:MAG: hypothetical protein ACREOI_02265 [bacterium]
MRTKISTKYLVVALIAILLLYNIFVPDDFLKRIFSPKEYWSERVASLNRLISTSEKIVYELSLKIRTQNASKEIQEMAQDFMKGGIAADSAINLASKTYLNGIKSQELLLEAFTNHLSSRRKLLEEAKRELDKVSNK